MSNEHRTLRIAKGVLRGTPARVKKSSSDQIELQVVGGSV